MGTPVILLPGDGQYALGGDGSTLRMLDDGSLWRNGTRYAVGGVSFAAARVGIYGQWLFARGKTDNKLWLSGPTRWIDVTVGATGVFTMTASEKSQLKTDGSVDTDFYNVMMSDAVNEPT